MKTQRNWAGNYEYSASALQAPTSLEQVQELVAGAGTVRALGSRHSFNSIADTDGLLLSLEDLDPGISLDRDAQQVRVGGGVKYGVLAQYLQQAGFALHNLASLPHISVAGAVATATHGSGNANGNLATAVAAMDIVTADGSLRTVRRGDADFNGMVVSLGALGVVTSLTLDVEKHYDVRQDVFLDLPFDQVLENFDAVTSSAYSVSLFTDWRGDAVRQGWFKSRTTEDAAHWGQATYFGGTAATADVHPLPGMSAENCTPQQGVPGAWSDRLSHFRMGFTPSRGEELQSEYLLPREHAAEAVQAMRALQDRISPLLIVAEIRTMAADDLWLSANYGRDGIGLHFTWKPLQDQVEDVLPLIEEALAPFSARPHWGKVYTTGAAALGDLYPRMGDFRRLARTMDPKGKFTNAYLRDRIFGAGADAAADAAPAVGSA